MLYQQFPPNQRKVEIEITTECNIRCYNCNRSCRQAPSAEMMTGSQIDKFVRESMDSGWHWHYIGILGGEPTLHPDLEDICLILLKYKKEYPCVVELVTNGFGDRAKSLIEAAPSWLQIKNSQKTGPIQLFTSYNIAPMDLNSYVGSDFSRGCPIAEHYGMGLTRYGYYPCGPGASIDRVLGFDIGIKTLTDVCAKSLLEQLNALCRYCGHFSDFGPREERILEDRTVEGRQSLIWQRAYRKYHEQRPVLSTY